jgi:hypothetical protein
MSSRSRWIAVVLFVAALLAATGPIRSYDLFWHLATGRWIVEHRALPLTDPFAVASDRSPWINGEWLFEVAAYAVEQAGGIGLLSWVRGLLAASIFTLSWWIARRDADDAKALLLTAIAFAGAMQTLDMRPSGVAPLLVVAALAIRGAAAHFGLAVLWINLHPSALLAPFLAAVREAGDRWPRRAEARHHSPVPWFFASAAGLLLNPHGIEALTAPLHLMSWVQSGAFVNAEWLPATPRNAPLFYLCLVAGVATYAVARLPREEWWRLVLFAALAFLGARHVRNQALFFAAFPVLVAPAARSLPIRPRVGFAAAGVTLALLVFFLDHRSGVAPERFPIAAVARLQATRMTGNIYTPDQFGGYVEWVFYPERRALTDGRNELFRAFIPEYARARNDERAWRALLAHHRIDLAVDEYRRPLPVIDAATGRKSSMPASLAYWPRTEWALIAKDDAAMVFARRKAFPAGVIDRWELKGPAPDAQPVN